MAFKVGINQNMNLIRIAALTGFATVTMGLMFRSKVISNVKQTDFYKEALKTVRSHAGAVHFLGEPIKDLGLDIGNTNINYTKILEAKYEVPVKGPKQRGKVYFWAHRPNEGEPWSVTRIELGLDNEPDRRLVIKS